jgi:peptide/nickel transport system ATP-binding protein
MIRRTPLLEAVDLARSYHRGRQRVNAVQGVSLTVFPGETLGLVGESGSGKSTLGRLLVRLEAPDRGQVFWAGRPALELRGHGLRTARRHYQMVFQDAVASLNPRFTVGETLSEALQAAHPGAGRATLLRDATRLLKRVGLDPAVFRNRRPMQLSGGQAQRIAIARALAAEPRFLALDEPFSALDPVTTAELTNLLLELQSTHDLGYLFITHDLGILGHLADRIAVMCRGEIVEQAAARPILEAPDHPYTRALLARVPGQRAASARRADSR